MTIQEFVQKNASIRPNADIQERWGNRIEAQGMHTRGATGADAYIGQYGKGMKAPKAVMFARMAEIKGCTEMANRFWEHAYFFETGTQAKLGSNNVPTQDVVLPQIALKESFGQNPELLTLVSYEEALHLAALANYGLQEKKDGRRLLTRVQETDAGTTVIGGNKKGLSISPSLGIADALKSLGTDVELDGEDVKGVYHVFDLLSLGTKNYRGYAYLDRHLLLTNLLREGSCEHLKLVPLYTGSAEKLAFIEELRAKGAEGFVLKPVYAHYQAGDNGQKKYQFRAQSTFIVGARNGAKSSVALSVYRPDGSLRDMGNLSIPGKTPTPEMGSVVEVEYLYCHTGPKGKLHQPVFKGVRDDSSPEDCLETKLKVKEDPEDE